jgi:3-methylcrotonyl-CoA carboxylase alpha subunit
MEMNTRLQVEHPVTEMITGIDLVEWQLRVAAGEVLPRAQGDVERRGHAIECRLYAERPEHGFLPSTGRIEAFAHPQTGDAVRIDSGVEAGDTVTIHYDPMIAKLVTFGIDRAAAIDAMRALLADTTVVGVDTNIALLGEILGHARFRAGEVDTTFVDRELEALVEGARELGDAHVVAAALHGLASTAEEAQREAGAQGHGSALSGGTGGAAAGARSPWHATDHWRASSLARRRLRFGTRDGGVRLVEVRGDLAAPLVHLAGEDRGRDLEVVVSGDPRRRRFAVTFGGTTHAVTAQRHGQRLLVTIAGRVAELDWLAPFAVEEAVSDEDVHPTAPMPGRVVSLEVSAGSAVSEGDALLTLEGMKMEYTLRARRDGVVASVHCAVGDTVDADVPLVSLREDGA